jgi:PAS domain S-box-containing protein
MTFGQRLKELRQAKGMTQIELAQKTAISFTYVSKLETGAMPPPKQKIILALAKALGVNKADTDKLFGLAKKIPSDLLSHVDIGMIEILRSLKHEKETPAHELAISQQRIAEPEASGTKGIRLKESPERQKDIFRALVDNSPDGIVVLSSELEIIYENPVISRTFGYEPGEFLGKDTLGVIHPDDMSKAAHGLTAMIQTPADCTSIRAQLRVRHKDGTWRVIDAIANNLLQDPAVKGVIIDIREMSRQSWDEQARVEDSSASAVAKEYHLTQTERKVLNLIAEGLSNPQIAAKLVVSPSTVRFHVTSILRKLGVTSRTAVAAIAVRRRLVA